MFVSNSAKFAVKFKLLLVKEVSFVKFPSIVSLYYHNQCTYSHSVTCLLQTISTVCASHLNLVKSEYNLKIHESIGQFNYATNSFPLSFY